MRGWSKARPLVLANAALRSIVRRDTGATYQEFLTQLAQASGIDTPTREDLAQIDRKRPKKGSNDDWTHPLDPDAKITKMKDGRTHLACPPLRNTSAAPRAPAGSRQYSQAAAGACRRTESRLTDAHALWRRHATKSQGRVAALLATLWSLIRLPETVSTPIGGQREPTMSLINLHVKWNVRGIRPTLVEAFATGC